MYADPAVHWPVDGRLYLPEQWTDDKERCAKAGVPSDVRFQTKPQIALDLLDDARSLQIPHSAVIADSSYGGDDTFLSGLEKRERKVSEALTPRELYVVGIPAEGVAPEAGAIAPRCDFRVIAQEDESQQSHRADEVLRALPKSQWTTIRWREGNKGWLRKKFIAVRAYRSLAGQPLTQGWLIGERPARGQTGDWKYYFTRCDCTP